MIEGDRLYGRGGADDGYSAFAALSALEAVRAAGGSHARCLVLIEASEESGSPDLPAHVEALGDRLGEVSLVVCLDSFAGDYDTLWVTTSLRGLVGLDLRVRVLEEGVHSGVAGGTCRPASGSCASSSTGSRTARPATCSCPSSTSTSPTTAATKPRRRWPPGLDPVAGLPFSGDTRPEGDDPVELLLATTWQPSMAVVGIEGAPAARRRRQRPAVRDRGEAVVPAPPDRRRRHGGRRPPRAR